MYLPINKAAELTGLTPRRIMQLIEVGKLRTTLQGKLRCVHREDVETLRREQTFLRPGEACRRLSISRKQLALLVQKGLLKPDNDISELALFDPVQLEGRRKEAEACFTIRKAAKTLGLKEWQVRQLIKHEVLGIVETIYGRRVPGADIATYLIRRRLDER